MVTEDSSKQVYIFENVLYPILKIGISDNPLKRKTTIENASGFPLNLIYESEPVKRPKIVEALIHKKFKEYRQKGEWFIIDKESAIKEIEEVIKESQLGEYKDLSKDFQLERECVKVLD